MRERRKQAIAQAINELANSFGGLRPAIPLDDPELRALYERKDVTGMVRTVRDHMRLRLRIRVGIVTKCTLTDSPAFVLISELQRIPMYGTRNYDQHMVTVYLRKSFIEEGKFETVVFAIAHELSHILTCAIRHRLAKYEMAVDLTAMVLGYRLFYLTGAVYEKEPKNFLDRTKHLFLQAVGIRKVTKVGYLTMDEISFAHNFIEQKASQN